MIKYQTPDPNSGTRGPRRSFSTTWSDFRYRNILLIVAFAILLAVVAYSMYQVGVNRGIEVGNADRDAFYRQRLAELSGYGASNPNSSSPSTVISGTAAGITATPATGSTIATAQGTLARVDKIEGDKMTVLVLDSKTGSPTGVSLVISLSQQPLVWRSDRTDSTALTPGQNILFVGENNASNGTYTVKGVLILPLAES